MGSSETYDTPAKEPLREDWPELGGRPGRAGSTVEPGLTADHAALTVASLQR